MGKHRMITCDKCGREYEGTKRATKHTKMCERRGPFKCETCQKEHDTIRGLRIHRYSHGITETPQYSCKRCGKKYHSKSGLSSHYRKCSSEPLLKKQRVE